MQPPRYHTGKYTLIFFDTENNPHHIDPISDHICEISTGNVGKISPTGHIKD